MKTEIITFEEFTRRTGIKVTTKHNGKMEGMDSMSTDCQSNRYCKERAKNGDSVCRKCYAERMMKRYKNLKNAMKDNLDFLSEPLRYEDLPNINALYFRFEAFGDLDNEVQFINYLNICKKNPKTRFALWTKNPWIIQNAFDSGYKKPKNLNIVLSSIMMNEVDDYSRYDWVDRVFTVYDKKYIEEHDVNINCGSRKCMSCLKCYNKSKKYFYINEQVK